MSSKRLGLTFLLLFCAAVLAAGLWVMLHGGGTVRAQSTPGSGQSPLRVDEAAIVLTKTVGTDPNVCASTDEITVDFDSVVTYCFAVTNTGTISLPLHSLIDDHLGNVLVGFPFMLTPGSSAFLTQTTTILENTTNSATWTAYSNPYAVDGAATYSYYDLSATGTPLFLQDDGEIGLTLPFEFTFFGQTSDQIVVGNNGGILFGIPDGQLTWNNQPLPYPIFGAPAILPFWDDIDSDTGNVYYQTFGAAPNRIFVVEWYDRPHWQNSPGHVTFEVLLYEGSNHILFQYADVNFDNPLYDRGASATIGLNFGPVVAQQYSYNQAVLNDGQAILYTPQAYNLVEASDTATVNVLAPRVLVEPGSLETLQPTNMQVVRELTISNTGLLPLDWSLSDGIPGGPGLPEPSFSPEQAAGVSKPAPQVTSAADCAQYENYAGAVPEGYAEFCLGISASSQPEGSLPAGPLAPTDTGFVFDNRNDHLASFVLNDFPGQTALAADTSVYLAMDFYNTSTLVGINDTTDMLGTFNQVTGVFSPIVACPPPGGASLWSGLTFHPLTLQGYASTPTALYTIVPGTCTVNLVGTFTTTLMIDIAMNAYGELYGHDIGTDTIYRIDPQTAALTPLGPTGYNANFAQGMDFDNDDNTLYIFLYIGGGANVYGTVDLETGAVTPLSVDTLQGVFEGAVRTNPPPCLPLDLPWLSISASSGTVQPGESTTVEVTFDSSGLPNDLYEGLLCIESNDQLEPLIITPVSMQVDNVAYLRLAHLSPFAEDPNTAVTVFLDGDEYQTGFEYGDTTGYVTVLEGNHLVEVYTPGSALPIISANINLSMEGYYTVFFSGDTTHQPLQLVTMEEDFSPPAAGNFRLTFAHYAPFESGDALVDLRRQNGDLMLNDLVFAGGMIGELPAGTYDLIITAPDGGSILIDPLPVTFQEGEIVTLAASGNGGFQPLGVFAMEGREPGAMLPLVEHGVQLTPASQAGSALIGQQASYELQISNTGNFSDTFSLAPAMNSWSASLNPNSVTLAAGGSAAVTVTVNVPSSAEAGETDDLTVRARSTIDPSTSAQVEITTTAEPHLLMLPLISR